LRKYHVKKGALHPPSLSIFPFLVGVVVNYSCYPMFLDHDAGGLDA
jgi:hypothetical protein